MQPAYDDPRREFLAILEAFRASMEGLPYFPTTDIPPIPIQTPSDNTNELNQFKNTALSCTACPIAQNRRHVVFGTGNPQADLMVIGEAPGSEEDAQGIPFVGKAGQLLSKMFAAINFSREEIYITNIIKCRPPGNRDPEPEEIENCRNFLNQQIKLISPLIICTLGRPAAQTLLGTGEGITRLRGQLFDYNGIPLIPIYHPAYLLRSPGKKKEAWQDLQFLRKKFDEIKTTLS